MQALFHRIPETVNKVGTEDSLQTLRKQCGLQGTRGNLVVHNSVASVGSNIESLTPANLF